MINLFLNYKDKKNFHSKCLSQLFFDTLNNGKRENFIFTCEGLEGELNNSKVPYLNGGLFDTDEDISKKNRINVLVGNSTDPTNEHISIFDMIEGEIEFINKIYCRRQHNRCCKKYFIRS